MKKDLLFHFSFLITFFALISLFKQFFSLDYLQLWLGGIVGTLLPDIDHLLYAYVIHPQDLSSQRMKAYIAQKQYFRAWDTMVVTTETRPQLIFHSVRFQLILLLFTLLIVTSGNLFGKGIVLAFSLHLIVDQAIDLMERKSIDHWFYGLPFTLDTKQKLWYFWGMVAAILILGFFF